mgnify:CR=1 FL=1
MAFLVHAQGEIIDNIEININSTAKDVKAAEGRLTKGKEYSESAKKVL